MDSNKVKSEWKRLLLAVSLCIVAMGASAQSCYTRNYNEAESLYQQGQYDKAKRRYAAAKACPDKPKNNNLDARIRACDQQIARQRQREEQRQRDRERENRRRENRQTGNIRITRVDFRNEDYDDNVLDPYGATLYASDIYYLMPRLTYEGLSSTSHEETFYYKIYDPSETLMSGSSSPSGYTSSFRMTVHPGENTASVSGWGNKNGGAYVPGRYRYEVWYNGYCICSTSFTLYSKSTEASYLTVDNKTAVSSTFPATGGSETFYVSTNGGSWTTWGVPTWCSISSRSDGSFTLSCEPNTTGSSRSDYMKVQAGGMEVRIDITQAASAISRSGEIEEVWVDYDQWENGRKGMLIHVKFTVNNMLNRTGRCAAYFFYQDGNRLEDYNDNYSTPDGQVAFSETFVPKYENTRFKDFQLFMPYEELHLSSGRTDLKFYILIYDEETQEDLAPRSDYHNFYITK